MDRTVPFDSTAVCDVCGATGAYDFMGDIVCADCCGDLSDEPSDEDMLEHEEFDDDEDRDLDDAVPNNGP